MKETAKDCGKIYQSKNFKDFHRTFIEKIVEDWKNNLSKEYLKSTLIKENEIYKAYIFMNIKLSQLNRRLFLMRSLLLNRIM